jgi:sec-independent protein translocase protein TatA
MLAFNMPGMGEWIVIAAVGLLLFGKRLPEVGRSLGKGIVEFKKGLKGVEDEVDTASEARPATSPQHKFDPYTGKPMLPAGYKFDPMTGKPVDEAHADAHPASDTTQSSPSAEKTVG